MERFDLSIVPDYEASLPATLLAIVKPLHETITYNGFIVEELVKTMYPGQKLTEDEKRNLGRYLYICRGLLRKEKEEEHKKEMLAAGWLVMDEEVVKKAATEKKRLEVTATTSQDWMTWKADGVYKPFVNQAGDCFLMKARARTRGQALFRFEHAFCRIV